ncbi:MAG: UDP-N-acetylmuramoyl-L-alanyl-D-glutamate--2,6-diaminopimelate ligase [Holosporales bacterium]|nr:UDP-N-acetylmuramoyl-L-alanyl-D-glutamate--2,6-diaminopimelate ligase [Holosporales bacterium]
MIAIKISMKDIQINSKFVKEGDIFVAIPCQNLERNINEALDKKAEIVFAEESKNDKVLKINDARLLASRLAKFKYNRQPEFCVSITGTNGKSSVAHFLRQIWTHSEKKAGNLGTLGLFIDEKEITFKDAPISNLTTPDPITLHKIMEYAKRKKVTHFVLEASSHALNQKRLHSIDLAAAAFTNLASDHLDYHKTEKAYLASKLKLFEEILECDRPAIVSRDYPRIHEGVSKFNKNIISFGFDKTNFIRAKNIREFEEEVIFDLVFGGRTFPEIKINLFGNFQIMNVLCAISLAFSVETKIEDIIETLPAILPLSGRMERIASFNKGNIYVDYAHTSEGLKSALTCFKKICKGRLICLFGCGGNRDKTKREEMGKIADQLSDVVIVTDDNPRNEPPSEIRQQIIKICPKAIEIGNRKEAIFHAISLIEPGDSVVVIGKGHEVYQIYSDKTIPFNDKEEVLKIIRAKPKRQLV